MRLLLLACLSVPVQAQFESIELRFEGVGCASCVDSMPERVRRMRGVESAVVDKDKGVLTVKLGSPNRVRLEQVRDAIEQDGTKARSARVVVRGAVSKEAEGWILQPAGGTAKYGLEGDRWKTGDATVSGDVVDLHPAGPLRIRVGP